MKKKYPREWGDTERKVWDVIVDFFDRSGQSLIPVCFVFVALPTHSQRELEMAIDSLSDDSVVGRFGVLKYQKHPDFEGEKFVSRTSYGMVLDLIMSLEIGPAIAAVMVKSIRSKQEVL